MGNKSKKYMYLSNRREYSRTRTRSKYAFCYLTQSWTKILNFLVIYNFSLILLV